MPIFVDGFEKDTGKKLKSAEVMEVSMSDTKLVGIIDVQSSGNDNLDINVHADSLKSFIEKTSITRIQGEWGKNLFNYSIYSDFGSEF